MKEIPGQGQSIQEKSKRNNTKQKIATLSILIAGSLWGTMGLFVRGLALDGLTSVEIVFFRTVIAALLLGLWILVSDRGAFRIKLKDLWCFIGTGIISLTFFNICYFSTIQMTSMAVAAIMLYTSPVFVILLSAVLFKERLTKIKGLALVLAFVGCVLVTGVLSSGGQAMSFAGILLGLGSGIGYALYSIFGRYALERGYSSKTISFYTFLTCSLGLLIISPLLSPISVTVSKIANGNVIRDILLITGVALFATVFPYLLYTFGLSGVENGKAGIMASIEPVVASVLGIVVYKESLSVTTLAGIVLVLGAVVILNIGSNTENNAESDT